MLPQKRNAPKGEALPAKRRATHAPTEDTRALVEQLRTNLRAHDNKRREKLVQLNYDMNAHELYHAHWPIIDRYKQALRTHGVLIFSNAVPQECIDNTIPKIARGICEAWSAELPEEFKTEFAKSTTLDDLFRLNPYRIGGKGFGNASLGYLFGQARDQYPSIKGADGNPVFLDTNPFYRIILEMLEEANKTNRIAELLMMLNDWFGPSALDATAPDPHMPRCIISPDSIKVSNNPGPLPSKMTKQKATQPHLDLYDVGRMQASVIGDKGSTRLFFVPGSAENIDLIARICGWGPDYVRNGARSIPDIEGLHAVLGEFAIAPSEGALVLWTSGTVHFEACAYTDPRMCATLRFKSFKLEHNQPCLRFPCGVICSSSQPNLTPEQREQELLLLRKIALLSITGLPPAVYFSANKKLNPYIDRLTTAKKGTQYFKKRDSLFEAHPRHAELVIASSMIDRCPSHLSLDRLLPKENRLVNVLSGAVHHFSLEQLLAFSYGGDYALWRYERDNTLTDDQPTQHDAAV